MVQPNSELSKTGASTSSVNSEKVPQWIQEYQEELVTGPRKLSEKASQAKAQLLQEKEKFQEGSGNDYLVQVIDDLIPTERLMLAAEFYNDLTKAKNGYDRRYLNYLMNEIYAIHNRLELRKGPIPLVPKRNHNS